MLHRVHLAQTADPLHLAARPRQQLHQQRSNLNASALTVAFIVRATRQQGQSGSMVQFVTACRVWRRRVALQMQLARASASSGLRPGRASQGCMRHRSGPARRAAEACDSSSCASRLKLAPASQSRRGKFEDCSQ